VLFAAINLSKLLIFESFCACRIRGYDSCSTKVLVLEKADDVTQGATKGNSGIVHAGYDDEPGAHYEHIYTC